MDKEFGSRPGFVFLKDLDDIRWYVNLNNCFDIDRGFDDHAKLKRWCEENCKDTVVYYPLNELNPSIEDRIYFFNEEDMLGFKLRWHEAII